MPTLQFRPGETEISEFFRIPFPYRTSGGAVSFSLMPPDTGNKKNLSREISEKVFLKWHQTNSMITRSAASPFLGSSFMMRV